VLTVIQRNERNDPTSRIGAKRNTPDRWLWLSHHDSPEEDMSGDFLAATDFIHRHLKDGHSVLTHCHAGISRSATMVTAYLLRFHASQFPSVESALTWLRERRWIVDPNPGFVKQLEGWRLQWIVRERG
jgi:protein-tyrosine phosphatase